MKGSDTVKKKSYSLVYRIYRRLRYVRFLNRKRKELLRQTKKEKKEEQRTQKLNLKEHITQLREEERVKLQYEKDKQKKEQDEARKRLKEQASLTQDILQDEVRVDNELKRKEKAILRRKRRRLLKYALRIQIRDIFRSVKSFRFSDLVDFIHTQAPAIKRFIRIVLNSTVLFLLAYFAIYLLAQAVTVLAATLFHYPTILYYWEIYFNISVEDWYHDSVKTIFSSGPIIALLTGIALMIIYNTRKELTGLFKLFFIWAFLHGVSMFFGAMLVGTLFESGIGHVISWMYIMDTGKVMYSIISIFMLVVAGMVAIKPFLISGNSYFNNMTRHNRRAFIWAQAILPYFFGNVILIALRLPRFMFYETFITLSLAIPLLPIISGYSAYTDLYFDEDKKQAFFEWKYFLILAVVILFYRGILNFGITIPG